MRAKKDFKWVVTVKLKNGEVEHIDDVNDMHIGQFQNWVKKCWVPLRYKTKVESFIERYQEPVV